MIPIWLSYPHLTHRTWTYNQPRMPAVCLTWTKKAETHCISLSTHSENIHLRWERNFPILRSSLKRVSNSWPWLWMRKSTDFENGMMEFTSLTPPLSSFSSGKLGNFAGLQFYHPLAQTITHMSRGGVKWLARNLTCGQREVHGVWRQTACSRAWSTARQSTPFTQPWRAKQGRLCKCPQHMSTVGSSD